MSDIQNADAYLIIGKTGSGKSTMCNAMVNWAWGINYSNIKRYKIINDELDDTSYNKGVGASVTFRINAYYVKIKNN